jgi:hypothetical protein
MATKRDVVLYLDKDLVEKSKELCFNLSKTFENHLKHLMTQFSMFNSVNNVNSTENGINNVGLPVPEPIWVQNLTSKSFFCFRKVALGKGFEPQFTSKGTLSTLFLKQQARWFLPPKGVGTIPLQSEN